MHVYSGSEKRMAEAINDQIVRKGMQDYFAEVLVPTEEVVEVRRGVRVNSERKFFPGYILIKMALTPQSKYVVENTQGVISFVGPKGSDPVPLTDKEIKRIFGEVADKEGREILTTSYKVGDMVQVISGPFLDFAGHIEEVNDEKQKVKVVVSIFGRPTPIELSVNQILSES